MGMPQGFFQSLLGSGSHAGHGSTTWLALDRKRQCNWLAEMKIYRLE
jgi:hypothetical protein